MIGPNYLYAAYAPTEKFCDIIYYDSLYKNGKNKLTEQSKWDESVTHYFNFAGIVKYPHTNVKGLSFSTDNDVIFNEYNTENFTRSLKNWNVAQQFFFGFMDLRAETTPQHVLKRALLVLKSWEDFLQPIVDAAKKSGFIIPRGPLCFGIGMSADSRVHYSYISDAMKQVYMPHIFVSLAHLSYQDDTLPDCRMRPITALTFPPGKRPSYGGTLDDAAELLRHLANENVDIIPVISLSMQGRFYRPKGAVPLNKFNFFDRCEKLDRPYRFQPIRACYLLKDNLAELERNLRYDESVGSILTYDEKLNLALVYENRVSIQKKICEFLPRHRSLNVSLAIYDVGADAHDKAYTDKNGQKVSVWIPTSCKNLLNVTEYLQRVYFTSKLFKFMKDNVTTSAVSACYSFPLDTKYSD